MSREIWIVLVEYVDREEVKAFLTAKEAQDYLSEACKREGTKGQTKKIIWEDFQ